MNESFSPPHYFHVVFTVPHELNVLALENPRVFYDLLFTASAHTMLKVAADPRHLGAEIGAISILHTWGQNLCCIRTFTALFLRGRDLSGSHLLDTAPLSFLSIPALQPEVFEDPQHSAQQTRPPKQHFRSTLANILGTVLTPMFREPIDALPGCRWQDSIIY